MLQDTALRAAGLEGISAPVIVCSEEHRFLAAEQLLEIGITPQTIILEPSARNTAPALAVAAMAVMALQPDSIMLVLPADHLIHDEAAFARAVAIAVRAATAGSLATFGIVPDKPETGYGYIECGETLADGCYSVKSFVEKPQAATAAKLVSAGLLWNSGMFVMSARRYVEELGQYRPDILASVTTTWEKRSDDRDFCRLDAASFAACPAESIDYAVMERTTKAAVVPADIGWSDVGSWATLWETAKKNQDGNVVRGDIDAYQTRNSYLRAESRMLSVTGLDNVVVVETSDAVLVTTRDNAQAVKDVVSRLDGKRRTEHLNHRRVYRPWGYYESIDASSSTEIRGASQFQVKRLMVKPGAALSLQLHHRRTEHWVVVSGVARVTVGDSVMMLSRDQSTYIPKESKHRLENPGAEPLYLIEVQSGDYLGEDDIVRFEDIYKRA